MAEVVTTALEDQQRLTKDLEERRAKAEQDRILLERERVEAEKKASLQISGTLFTKLFI